jgi:hypothetical protein
VDTELSGRSGKCIINTITRGVEDVCNGKERRRDASRVGRIQCRGKEQLHGEKKSKKEECNEDDKVKDARMIIAKGVQGRGEKEAIKRRKGMVQRRAEKEGHHEENKRNDAKERIDKGC